MTLNVANPSDVKQSRARKEAVTARSRKEPRPSRQRLVTLVSTSLLLAPLACRTEDQAATTFPTSQPTVSHAIKIDAEKGPLSVMLKADRDRLAAGESLILTIRVEVEEGVRVQAPKIEGILGQFEVKRSTERQPACPDQKSCIEWQLTLECVMPGIATIPALPFAFEDPREKADGSTEVYRDELATEPIEITVEGGLADVKGPVTVPIPFQYQLLWWGLGVLGAVALIAMLARRFAKRASAASELSAEIAEPAHVWALRELERVAADKLLERGRIKEYFYRIDAILRGYVERRFGLMAAEQTSEEFVRALQDADVLDEDQKAVLQRFVAACDPVKYAKQRPSEDSIAWIGSCARDFVLQTMQTHTDDNAKHTASPTDRSATAEARR